MTYTTSVRVLLFGFLLFLCVPSSFAHADDAASSTPDVVATSTTDVSIATSTCVSAASDVSLSETSPCSPAVGESDTSLAAPTTPTETVQITIRAGDTIATSSLIALSPNATTTSITPTGTTTPITSSAKSVLAALELLAASSTDFTISDLQYYASYGAFYLNCLSVPAASSTPLCSKWQYSVNGTTPSVGMDSYQLSDHDIVFIYFGYPRQVVLDTSSVTTNAPFTVTAESYDPATNTYTPAPGLVVGITQPDPANPWSPMVIATSTSASSGQATFTVSQPGTYAAGLAEDYYTPATSFSVTDAATSTPPTIVGGGGGGSPTPQPGDTALAYLLSQQRANGSFTGTFIDDWVALALASHPAALTAANALRSYLDTAPADRTTDYERRAMALEALGDDPYGGTNAVQHVVDAFDGTQTGDSTSVNDDIFALFPLLHAGYTVQDPLIQKETAYILAQQSSNGSWDSVDLTAAAAQALAPLTTLEGVTSALTKAKAYLRSHESGSGCVGNEYATSWVLQAVTALGDTPTTWQSNTGATPLTCLTSYQQADGGFEPTTTDTPTRIWATAYALLGLEGRPWNTVLQNFSHRPTTAASAAGTAGVPLSTSSLLIATTTSIATTTPPEATSTPTTTVAALTPLSTATPATSTPPIIAAALLPTLTHTNVHKAKQQVPKDTSIAQHVTIPTEQLASVGTTVHRSFLFTLWHYVASWFVR